VRSASMSARRWVNSAFCAEARALRSTQPDFSRLIALRRCVRRSISRVRLLTVAAASATAVRSNWVSARAVSSAVSRWRELGSADLSAVEFAKRASDSVISRSNRALASSNAERRVTCSFWRRSAPSRLSRSASTVWRVARTRAKALPSASTASLTASLACS